MALFPFPWAFGGPPAWPAWARVRGLIAGLLLLLGLAGPGLAMSDLILQRDFLEDPRGELSIDTIQAATHWTRFTGPLPLRNKGTPFWIRLEVAAPPTRENWVLTLIPGMLQDIQVFQQDAQGRWQVQRLGNQHAFAERERSELTPTVLYHPTAGSDTSTVYVRVRSDNSLVHFRVMPATESRELDTQTHVLVGLYMGFGLVVMCISLISWKVTHLRVWGFSAGFDLATFALLALQMGAVHKYLLPHSEGVLNQIVLVVNCLQFMAGCLVYRGMYRLFNTPGWCLWLYTFIIWWSPVPLAMIGLGHGGLAMASNNLLILLISVWGGVVGWFAPIQDRPLRVLFRTFNTCVVLYLVLWIAPALLPFQIPTTMSLYPALPSNFFTMLMSLVIMGRYTQLEIQRRRALERQKQETDLALHYEQQRHAETNSFLSMVLHELKNPLSLLRVGTMNLERDLNPSPAERAARFAKIQRAIENIDAILERCVAVDHLEQGALVVQAYDENLTELLAECAEQTQQSGRIQLELEAGVRAQIDGILLRLMVRNLLDNALRYGDPATPVTLRLQASAKTAHIAISNRPGRGGWPNPDKLFQKYYRAPSALFSSGTGLGLYWVSQVARLMDATVRYVPDDTHITFELSLPC